MIHTSPLPEITVPDKLLTPYVLQRADHLADTPALVEGASGRTLTYGGIFPVQ